MKALILTCNTGEGHNSTTAAVEDVFRSRGISCDRADTLAFLSRLTSVIVCNAHARIYRYIPKAFSAGYRAAETHPDAFERKSFLYRLLTRGVKKLHKFAVAGGYDTIVCAHAFSALLVTALREKYPEMKFHCAFVATDYTCSPSVKECNMDVFFIPDASLTEDFVSKGIAAERVIPSGLPVRAPFLTCLPRQEAAARCGLPEGKRQLLMMCGSMGCGPMEELTELLSAALPDDVVMTVICGTNEKLRRKLERRFAEQKQVNILGFVKNVSELMDCSDLYLTKPGGISVTEASAKGLPMVLVDAVAGCEEYNLQYYVSRGMAQTAGDPQQLCDLCVSLLSDDAALADMRAQIERHAHNDAAERIFEYLLDAENEEKTGEREVHE